IKSIMHGRPVLASSDMGLLKLFIDTDLVVIEDTWNPDNVSLTLLRILNEIDRFKKVSLSKIPSGIDNSKGIMKIISFLK
ncbi:MAG: glycosyltransferase family 1 protein, partial [Staphylothermus sp.]|nr:glycosyltransferase family 1 protein [Staphylothermus sp.]